MNSAADSTVETAAQQEQQQGVAAAVGAPSLPAKRAVSVVEKSGFSSSEAESLTLAAVDDSVIFAAPPSSQNEDSSSGGPAVVVESGAAVASSSTSSNNNNTDTNDDGSPKEVVDDEEDSSNKNEMNSIEDDPMSGGGGVVNDDPPVAMEQEEEEEEEDYSDYEYEDDDDVAFSGFLMSSNAMHGASATSAASSSAPARIEEDSGAAAAASSSTSPTSGGSSLVADASSTDLGEAEQPAKKKWREPTRAAVKMSLRAEKETSGGKRRLAQDLYKIMNQDTEEAGFSLAPKSEDSMELWTIKLFQFDPDSNLAKDMMVLRMEHIELEMKFPDQYPFEPPFVRVVKPRFKRQTGFVMNGALCMELLTKDGWNPINDIESVIVSIRSLLVVGDGRLEAAEKLSEERYEALLNAAQEEKQSPDGEPQLKKPRLDDDEKPMAPVGKGEIGAYSASEAQSAYSHLSDYHKKKGWDTSGWWARKG
ncbi:MAG: hypothetical protein SGILL_005002 [Bacillariaceae sp.]